MNFKPNRWKVIGSITIAVFVWILTYVPTIYPIGSRIQIVTMSSLLTILSLIIVYSVWSLIEKKKRGNK